MYVQLTVGHFLHLLKIIGDTRASCHITCNNGGMFDVKIINETVLGSSGTMKATKLGKKKVEFK